MPRLIRVRSPAQFVVLFGAVVLAPVAAGAQVLRTAAGEALRLVRHDVELRVVHPLATTVVTQEFENPHLVDLEAFFTYAVPAGATVHGLALWVKGERREARVLERQRAREIYDGIVRQKRDPALLERLDGNTFRIRIYPVLARARTRVELRFAQPVEQDGPGRYRLTLARPPGPTVQSLRLGLRLESPFALSRAVLDGPAGDSPLVADGRGALVRPLPAAPAPWSADLHLRYGARVAPTAPVAAVAVRGGERFLFAEVPLVAGAAPRRRLALLLDGSRTMRDQLAPVRSLAHRIVDTLGPRDLVAVSAFDLLPRDPLRLREADEAGRVARQRIQALVAQRGTAFVPAVLAAIAGGARQIILVTDGGAAPHVAELEHLGRLLHDRPGVQLSVVATARSSNEEPLTDLTAISGGLYRRLDPRTDLAALASALVGLPPRVTAELESGQSLQLLRREPHRLLVTLARPATDARPLVLLLPHAGQRLPPAASSAASGASADGVRALHAAAAIDALMRRIKLFGDEDALRPQIVRLSQQHHVLSEYTALLATETDADYARPTSGQVWQRQTAAPDDLPGFQSTPEPHEWAMILLGLALLAVARRRWGVALRP